MLTLVLWLSPEHYFGGLPLDSLRWAMLLVLVAGSATFWLVFWPLKRIEANADYLYASNYFKTARYSWKQDVAGISQQRLFLLSIHTVELNGKGAFGSRLHFLASRKLLKNFRETHPDLFS